MIEWEVIEDLMDYAEDLSVGYCCKHFGDKNPTLVIVGEKHSNKKERCFQDKLIEKLEPKPKYVLIEILDKQTQNEFRMWREKYGCELVPCDLTDCEKRDLRRKLSGYENDFSFEVQPELKQQYHDAKEMKMGEIILNYSGKSSKPLIAIIGHWHARNDSKIHDKLKGHIDYICIWDQKEVERIRNQLF